MMTGKEYLTKWIFDLIMTSPGCGLLLEIKKPDFRIIFLLSHYGIFKKFRFSEVEEAEEQDLTVPITWKPKQGYCTLPHSQAFAIVWSLEDKNASLQKALHLVCFSFRFS